MNPSRSWNITTMNVREYIKREFLSEVTSPMMYEPSSTSFHPFGLYSERIFGQVGTPERISKLGYISLHCDILNPIVYLNIIAVCSWYKDLIEGKIYAIYDEKEESFTVVDKDNPEAKTGFAFFMEHVAKLKYQKNDSRTRSDKIDVISKSIKDDSYIINHLLVCPAGWRDVKTDSSGKLEVDAVNKLYTSLLVMSTEIKSSSTSPLLRSFFDNVKYHIQLKVVELFTHWKTFYEGKTGFGQAHYSKRNLALGTRGVITTPPMLATSPDDPRYIKHNETHLPLYHCAKAFIPVVVHALNVLFTAQIYTLGSIKVPAINPKDLTIKYVEVEPSSVTYALDSKSKHGFINSFSNTLGRHDPVTIDSVDGQSYYMWLVYDLDTDIYLFRNIKDLEELINNQSSHLRSGQEALSKSLFHIFGATPDMEFFKKEGLLSPKILYEKNKELFHKTVYSNYHGRASTFLDRTDLDDKDILDYLENDPRRKDMGLNSSSIFFALSTKSTLTHINTDESFEISISIDTLKKEYPQYPPILIQGVTSKQLTWDELENNWEQYQDLVNEGISKQVEENPELTYKYIPHIAINCGSIPAALFTLTEGSPDNTTIEHITVDISKVRSLTKIEMLYIATHYATNNKFVNITRFPAIEVGSTYPSHCVVMSTSPARCVKLRSQYNDLNSLELPNYPIIGREQYIDSTILHPSKTSGLQADFDGDKISVNGIMSTEALRECEHHLNEPNNLVSPGGKFYDTLDTKIVCFGIHALTRLPEGVVLPEAE